MDETKHLEMRFGALAVNKGFITSDQLFNALMAQSIEGAQGQDHRLLGSILVEMGHMNPSQVRETLKAMGVPVDPL